MKHLVCRAVANGKQSLAGNCFLLCRRLTVAGEHKCGIKAVGGAQNLLVQLTGVNQSLAFLVVASRTGLIKCGTRVN